MDPYKQAMKQNYEWQQFYLQGTVQDNGVTSPEGYTLAADPQPPYVLTQQLLTASGAPGAPLYTNPSAMLYRSGNQNTVLYNSSTSDCSSGCIASVVKPDPRVHQVKPLYKASHFTGKNLPTAYNVVGMY